MGFVNLWSNPKLYAIRNMKVVSPNNKPILLCPNASIFYEAVAFTHTDVFGERYQVVLKWRLNSNDKDFNVINVYNVR